MSHRVVVTGAGIISSLGVGVGEFWRQCLKGKSMVTPIPVQWERYADFRSRLWSPLPAFEPESFGVTRTERLQLDPATALAIGAAREALERAGFNLTLAQKRSRALSLTGVDPTRVGVHLGSGIGGMSSFLHNHASHLFQRAQTSLKAYVGEFKQAENVDPRLEDAIDLMRHRSRFHPFVASMYMPNAGAAAVGIKFSITGPNVTYCVACAAGTVAVGHAYRAVRDGYVDVAVTGGCEYVYDEHGHNFRAFDVAGTLVRDCADADTANRPFDQKRSGFLFSEGGAAVLVLEELEHARRRGASIIAELIGFAETFDAHSMMAIAPGGEQIERMIRGALADAQVNTEDVDYINAHGTGTENNDKTEAEVIERVFGKNVLVNSTKSLLGHTIGASGAIEILVTALSLRDGTTHICKNLETPVRDLNFVRSVEQHDLNVGLSQSFAFGGHNAAVVLRRYD